MECGIISPVGRKQIFKLELFSSINAKKAKVHGIKKTVRAI